MSHAERKSVFKNYWIDDFVNLCFACIGCCKHLLKPVTYVLVFIRLSRNLGGVTTGLQGCVTALYNTLARTNIQLANTRESNILDGRLIGEKTCNNIL